MARFNAKIGKTKVETDAAEIDLGTRSTCTVVLDDPIAAEVHARIRFEDGRFLIEDAGSATGTWRNGLPVDGPEALEKGDLLVLGCARVEVTAAEPDLALAVEPRAFHFEISRKRNVGGKKVVGGDAEEWVRSEVAFGRFRPVSFANWIAVLLAVLGCAALAWPAFRGAALEPGPLVASHAELFAREPASFAGVELAGFAESAQREGCGACHGSFGGTPVERCGECHADIVRDRHPFPLARGAAHAALELEDGLCAGCHLDHQGAEPAPGTFVPAVDATPGSCTRCHEGELPEPTRRPAAGSIPERDVAIDYDAFPHTGHAAIACGVCHVAGERSTDVPADRVARDYPVVRFETCMRCHADDARTPNPAWKRDPALREHWAKERTVAVTWHGTREDDGARCTECHAEPRRAELRQVATMRSSGAAFELVRRDHRELFEAGVRVEDQHGAGRECAGCHVDGKPLEAGKRLERPFWHALHLPSVATPASVEGARALSGTEARAGERGAPGGTRGGTCRECHVEQIDSTGLAGAPSADAARGSEHAYLGPPTAGEGSSCSECHQDAQGQALELRALADAAGEVALRTQFPHAIHLEAARRDPSGTLRLDCFACHAFERHGRAFEELATTMASAQSCLPCHDAHQEVGGGACTYCHAEDDVVWTGATVARRWPEANGFSHASPGHAPETEKPDGCATCHVGVTNATTVAQVPIPTEADEACWKCHVEERTQFHWRGAAATR